MELLYFSYLLRCLSTYQDLSNYLFNYDIREQSPCGILQALRDETLNDPRDRIEIAQSHAFYRPSLLGQAENNTITAKNNWKKQPVQIIQHGATRYILYIYRYCNKWIFSNNWHTCGFEPFRNFLIKLRGKVGCRGRKFVQWVLRLFLVTYMALRTYRSCCGI